MPGTSACRARRAGVITGEVKGDNQSRKDWGLCCIRPQSVLLLLATDLLFLLALLFFLFFRAALFLLWLRALFLLGLAALRHIGHLLLGENAVGRY